MRKPLSLVFLSLFAMFTSCGTVCLKRERALEDPRTPLSLSERLSVLPFVALGEGRRLSIVCHHLQAYREGEAQTEQDVKHGRERWLQGDDQGYFLEEKWGLPVFGASYQTSDEEEARIYGHNERLQQEIDSHGVPKSSRKPWLSELSNLSNYVNHHHPLDLKVNEPQMSPDMHYRVVIQREPARPTSYLVHTFDARTGKENGPGEGRDPGTLVWGPQGSDLAILSAGENVLALDLRTGMLMFLPGPETP